MYRRITLILNQSELEQLRIIADQEYRTTRDQAKYLLIKALGGAGDKTSEPTNSKSTVPQTWQGENNGAFAGCNP